MATINGMKVVARKVRGTDLSASPDDLNPAHIPVDISSFSNFGFAGSDFAPNNLADLLDILAVRPGTQGAPGQNGAKGDKGESITSVSYDNNTGLLTIQGEGSLGTVQGYIKGDHGRGIANIVHNSGSNSITIEYNDSTAPLTVPLAKGDKGDKGDAGNTLKALRREGDDLVMAFVQELDTNDFTGADAPLLENNNTEFRIKDLRGNKGDRGEVGERGPMGPSMNKVEYDTATEELVLTYQTYDLLNPGPRGVGIANITQPNGLGDMLVEMDDTYNLDPVTGLPLPHSQYTVNLPSGPGLDTVWMRLDTTTNELVWECTLESAPSTVVEMGRIISPQAGLDGNSVTSMNLTLDSTTQEYVISSEWSHAPGTFVEAGRFPVPAPGVDGADGADGVDGADGADGADGISLVGMTMSEVGTDLVFDAFYSDNPSTAVEVGRTLTPQKGVDGRGIQEVFLGDDPTNPNRYLLTFRYDDGISPDLVLPFMKPMRGLLLQVVEDSVQRTYDFAPGTLTTTTAEVNIVETTSDFIYDFGVAP